MEAQQQNLLQKRLERLVAAGSKMRVAQNDYFRTRGPITLNAAKAAEYQFDRLIKEENKLLQSQQTEIF